MELPKRTPRLSAKFATIGLAIALCGPAAMAQASEVTLTNSESSLVVSGALISYDGAVYVLDSTFGRLSVNADNITCAGNGCPENSLADSVDAPSDLKLVSK